MQQEANQVRQLLQQYKPNDMVGLLQLCRDHNACFIDLKFPPVQSSVCRPGVDKGEMESTNWARPQQWVDEWEHEQICLFQGIDPNDINQGQLGDCWLMCSIASIAEFPKLIESIFSPNELSQRRVAFGYIVRLNKHGWWRDVVVDSYLPSKEYGPCFASTRQCKGELWVSLLEKAYAKVHGSYASIAFGDPLHAMVDLTGFAGWNISPRLEAARSDETASAALFRDMCRYDEMRFLMSVWSRGIDESDYNVGHRGQNDAAMAAKYKSAGLVTGHAYSVLQVKNFPQHGFRLIQIRNPWGGATEWTGEWSDDDPKWDEYPDVAQACGFTKAPDGTYWMSWRNFLLYFQEGAICVRDNKTVDCRVQGKFAQGVPSVCLHMRSRVPVKVMLTLSQKDPRGMPEGDPDSQLEAMMLSVAVPQGGMLNNSYCRGKDPFSINPEHEYSYDRDQSMEVVIQPGPASLAIPRIYDNIQREYTLGFRIAPKDVANVEVKFCCMPPDAPPFAGYQQFPLDQCSLAPTQAPAQVLYRDKLSQGQAPGLTAVMQSAIAAFGGDLPEDEEDLRGGGATSYQGDNYASTADDYQQRDEYSTGMDDRHRPEEQQGQYGSGTDDYDPYAAEPYDGGDVEWTEDCSAEDYYGTGGTNTDLQGVDSAGYGAEPAYNQQQQEEDWGDCNEEPANADDEGSWW